MAAAAARAMATTRVAAAAAAVAARVAERARARSRGEGPRARSRSAGRTTGERGTHMKRARTAAGAASAAGRWSPVGTPALRLYRRRVFCTALRRGRPADTTDTSE